MGERTACVYLCECECVKRRLSSLFRSLPFDGRTGLSATTIAVVFEWYFPVPDELCCHRYVAIVVFGTFYTIRMKLTCRYVIAVSDDYL